MLACKHLLISTKHILQLRLNVCGQKPKHWTCWKFDLMMVLHEKHHYNSVWGEQQHVNPSKKFQIFQSAPKWWTNRPTDRLQHIQIKGKVELLRRYYQCAFSWQAGTGGLDVWLKCLQLNSFCLSLTESKWIKMKQRKWEHAQLTTWQIKSKNEWLKLTTAESKQGSWTFNKNSVGIYWPEQEAERNTKSPQLYGVAGFCVRQ